MIKVSPDEIGLGDGWIEDDDCEFMWYRIIPHPLSEGDSWRDLALKDYGNLYEGLGVVMGWTVAKNGVDLHSPEFYVERDHRSPTINGGGRHDYGYVAIPIADKQHALDILATPARRVIELLQPALEWAKVVPTLVGNVDPRDRDPKYIKRLF